MPIKKSNKKKQGLQKKKSPSKKIARVKKVRATPTATSLRQRKSASLLRAVRLASSRFVRQKPHHLARHESNPIIEPRTGNYWEMKATFNPGAIYADKRVHLLYRAIGGDDVSVLGYAASDDGVSFRERLDEPAYMPLVTKHTAEEEARSAPSGAYLSGGGWNGGCEDPRLTLIDDRVYLTYTAFDGWGSVRIALSSIALEDLLNKQWNWKKPAMISPPGEIHKNWMLFPEKIHGKFAILHSIAPRIMIDYFDSLEDFDEEQNVLRGSLRKMEVSDPGRWEHLVRGAGPPPLKTKDGWLVLYHGDDRNDPGKYKLGAMMLDANDPTKVLYRSRTPILEPDFDYENNGLKAGIVYSCGAVIKDGELYVYYGGSDTVTCVAMANVEHFLNELKTHGAPKLALEKNKAPRTNGGR
jgi:beta-1,2-mannobiose phosphorylase / 1,2-beta-oligomannan phosphorylase